MARRNKGNVSPTDTLPSAYHTFVEWKSAFLPELAREDAYGSLPSDADQLARKLASDTFERVRRTAGI